MKNRNFRKIFLSTNRQPSGAKEGRNDNKFRKGLVSVVSLSSFEKGRVILPRKEIGVTKEHAHSLGEERFVSAFKVNTQQVLSYLLWLFEKWFVIIVCKKEQILKNLFVERVTNGMIKNGKIIEKSKIYRLIKSTRCWRRFPEHSLLGSYVDERWKKFIKLISTTNRYFTLSEFEKHPLSCIGDSTSSGMR